MYKEVFLFKSGDRKILKLSRFNNFFHAATARDLSGSTILDLGFNQLRPGFNY